ncbi:glycosyltransferase family protein [Haloplanus aerogenes]|nr:glycosyltransferase [Haloplanus aerogenes]RMB18225.1 glycosyl transferase family 1 [Haloplanus aerogenes]
MRIFPGIDAATQLRLRKRKRAIEREVLGKDSHTTIQCCAPRTTLNVHAYGLGDVMMARQMAAAFGAYLREYGDPEAGIVSLSAGGFMPLSDIEAGETTVFWWYSFGPMDDTPERFLDDVLESCADVEFDLLLCGSERIQEEARQAGYDTLYFPIGVYGYEPLGVERSGMGYAGSKNHKNDEKVAMLMGPYADREDFEWVDHFTTIDELNLWYNTRLVTFGLTKEGQRRWGVVNSRVFESLASGTPLIIPEHPTIDDVLGFEYPYQVSNAEETADFVDEILSDPDGTLETFRTYTERVREDHGYVRRLQTLFDAIA